MLVDFHVHSTESDGSLSIQELIRKAVAENIKAVALCDHDTTAGIHNFVNIAKSKNIVPITGIEISAEWTSGNCHILGLGICDNYKPLEDMLQKSRNSRDNRNHDIIKLLNDNGVNIKLSDVTDIAQGDVVARPHIARAMIKKGFVKTVKEAFDKFLAKGRCAYVDRFRLDPKKAVMLLKESGAVVVLAHPTQLNIDNTELSKFIESLIPNGLDGIEVYNPYANDKQISEYLEITTKYNLIFTGGSDFHGITKPSHKLGYYKKNSPIPESCLDNLYKISPNIADCL